ncbi:Crp/Fnr family transcriptional regulator [Kaarinaea lacus]
MATTNKDMSITTRSDKSLPAWLVAFPELRKVTDPVWQEVARRAKEVVVPAGETVFMEGDACKNYILVVNGATRVFKEFENGREMLLYRLQGGETCSLTTSMLLAGGVYPAKAVTEAETHAILIPVKDFDAAFDGSKGFRDFVCRVFGGRVRDLIMLLESITARNVDIRLARWLLDNSANDNFVETSHRELAFELGTAREVISRHLKEFEDRGWVKRSRKQIDILDQTALDNYIRGYSS